jgi:hypothetical protein
LVIEIYTDAQLCAIYGVFYLYDTLSVLNGFSMKLLFSFLVRSGLPVYPSMQLQQVLYIWLIALQAGL